MDHELRVLVGEKVQRAPGKSIGSRDRGPSMIRGFGSDTCRNHDRSGELTPFEQGSRVMNIWSERLAATYSTVARISETRDPRSRAE